MFGIFSFHLMIMMYFGKFYQKIILTFYFTIWGNFAPPPVNVSNIPLEKEGVATQCDYVRGILPNKSFNCVYMMS